MAFTTTVFGGVTGDWPLIEQRAAERAWQLPSPSPTDHHSSALL